MGDKQNNRTTDENSKIYFRRKSNENTIATTVVYPKHYDNLDDEAFLEYNNKIDNWESGILRSSAGAGNEKTDTKKDESKKTLSDQVAEGKYGLIQTEIFSKNPKRPGIISYAKNSEVPSDTFDNLGGLQSDDIWLAEDHLLVLKGGGLNKKDREGAWKPIDNYQAPLRQIKIPKNPKVPPPFPVQIYENGPIQFIGNNQIPFFSPYANESIFLYPETGKEQTNGGDKTNIFTGNGSIGNSPENKGYNYPPPIPPWYNSAGNANNESFQNPFLNQQLPFPFSPFPPFASNGSLGDINSTEPFDEDDPSLYYPPPYTFFYKSNYTNSVKPGPLVPGIILPPPPNFFELLDENNKTITSKDPIITKLYKQTVMKTTSTSTTPASTTFNSLRNNKISSFYNEKSRPVQTTSTTTTQKAITQLRKVVSQQPQQPILQFVPKINPPQLYNNDYKHKASNPVYFEYFDARNVQNKQKTFDSHQVPIETVTSTPYYHQDNSNRQKPDNSYLPIKPFDYDKYLYITPKPEIKPNGISTNYVPNQQTSFNDEIQTIKQTLEYYKTQPGYSTQSPRVAKVKPVYEYSFSTDSGSTIKNGYSQQIEFDTTPFQPMVAYSHPSVEEHNGFKAVTYSTNNKNRHATSTENPNYYSTPSVIPVAHRYLQYKENTQKTPQYEEVTNNYFNDYRQRINTENNQFTTIRPVSSTIKHLPWGSIEKQIVQELRPLQQSDIPVQRPYASNQLRGYSGYSRNLGTTGFNGYQYERPYYNYNREDQFSNQVHLLKGQIRNKYPIRNQYQVNISNDTYVNYRNPRPQINPDSEFIPQQREQNQKIINNYQNSYTKNQQQQQIAPPNLHRDILVNYRYPLPQINPDSEFILPQQQLRKQPNYRNKYLAQQQWIPSGDEQNGHLYYISPRDVKYQKK